MSQSPSPQTVADLPHEFVKPKVEFYVARVTYFDSGETASYSKIGPFPTVEDAKTEKQRMDSLDEGTAYGVSHTIVKVTTAAEVVA